MDKPKYTISENKLTTLRFDVTSAVECGGECTMPDYYPQIRKIVSCSAVALPDSKFISGNTLEYGGTMAFTVLYIGDDGALVSFPYATEYSGKEALSAEVRGTAEIGIDAKSEDVQCRVLAPRKLSLRARVKSRISSSERVGCRMQMIGESGQGVTPSERASIQSLSRSIPTLTEGRGATTGKISGAFHEKQGAKPISCRGSIGIKEVRCRKDSISVKGEAFAKALVFTSDGFYTTVRAAFPFEEIIPAEGAAEGDLGRAWGRIAAVSVSENENGEICAELEYDLEAEWCRKQSLSIVEDAYAANRASVCQYSQIASLVPLCCQVSSLSLSGSCKRTTKPSHGEYLIDVVFEAAIDRAEQRDDRMIFTGACKAKAYIASNGEVICEEASLPFKYEAKAESPLSEGRMILFADAAVTDSRGRLEGDSVAVSCELCLSVYAKRESKVSPVSQISLECEDNERSKEAKIMVIYGDGEERLWDISKKHRVSIGKTETANSLSRGDKIAGRPVIIPIGIG